MIAAADHPWTTALHETLAGLAAAERRRVLQTISSPQGPTIELDERTVILACANDYLGLASDRRLVEAAVEAAERWGVGAGASRLISGSMAPHQALETAVADWKGTEAALLFNSGYHANIGILSALLQGNDIVYSDALNHASLIDGCRLSRARVRVYRHADADHLADLLADDRHKPGRRLVVTDTIFSMDADEAPLAAICDIAERFDAWVMVDEAHGGGVLGSEGAGLVSDLGLGDRIAVQMGTFGKALGSFGAYAAGSQALVDVLLNRARSFVFTTALPPHVAATSERAIELVRGDASLRERVLHSSRHVRNALGEAGHKVLPGRVPILPVLVGGDGATMARATSLLEQGVLAVGIRPPTVPEGSARIRLTLSAAHSDSHLQTIIAACGDADPIRR